MPPKRIITYDNVVEKTLDSFVQQKNVHCGLIIGQCTDQKDIIVRLCPTPEQDDAQITAAEGDSSNHLLISDAVDLDEQWICQHAKQLMRALPGGLDILGFYVSATSDFTGSHQAELKQILFAVFNKLSKNRSFKLSSNERILLTICPNTKNILCKTCNIMDFRSAANPAEFRLSSTPMRWQQIRCNLSLDIKFPIKSEDADLSLQKQIEIGLNPFFENLKQAHALINGEFRSPDEILDQNLNKKKSKKSKLDDNAESVECYDVELFLPLETNNNISDPEECDCSCMMTFEGIVHCRAYVHSHASVGDAINALKLDIIRSVTARCEIHCEDLLLIEDEQDDPVIDNQLPRRVFAPLPETNLWVCDYQFNSNVAVDSIDAFKELMNLTITEDQIDTTCEPETCPTNFHEQNERQIEFTMNKTESSWQQHCYALAVIILILAIASYFAVNR